LLKVGKLERERKFIMKLGFLTPFSKERVEFAKAAGFDAIELRLQPGEKLDWQFAEDVLQENQIQCTAVACYANHLDAGNRRSLLKYFQGIIENVERLDCYVVATCTGCNQAAQQSGKIEDSLDDFRFVFSQNAKVAEANGVKIAFENWPGGHPWPLMMNLAFSPANWEIIFNEVSSPVLGLEYDPSHQARLVADAILPISQFAERIHHVHAKDTIIRQQQLDQVGYIGQGWWNYAIPSRGVIDWDAFFAALRKINYDGGVAIEHEDPEFMGDHFDDGLKLGQKFLAPYM
jgi:sugar phosphate isomerase/epimerase